MTDSGKCFQLKQQIAAKKISVAEKEHKLKESFDEAMQLLSPAMLLKKGAWGTIKNGIANAGAAKNGTALAGLFLADKFIFKKSGFLTKSIGMFAVKKLTDLILNKLPSHPHEHDK